MPYKNPQKKREWTVKNIDKIKEYNKSYYLAHKEEIRLYIKKWEKKNAKRLKVAKGEWNRKHIEEIRAYKKQWQLEHKEEIKIRHKESYKQNCEEVKRKARKYRNEHIQLVNFKNRIYQKTPVVKAKRRETHAFKMENDSIYRLRYVLRSRITSAITRQYGKKAIKSIVLLGAPISEVYLHIEKQFKNGMTWENHGEWHIDHIKPLASFDLSKEEEQRLAFHHTNLQPLWAKDNLAKGSKYNL